jgi:FHS family glucose/mannose:H+ symporter-like MFS transporter
VSFAATEDEAARSETVGGKALAGFLLSGFLLALLGAVLPAWGYHRDPPEFVAIGNYFLSLAAGIVAGAVIGRRIVTWRGVRFLLVMACVLACAALVYLAMVPPPLSAWWRAAGLVVLGGAAGCLNMGLFHAVPASLKSDVAGAVIRGGVWYGLGCLAATLLVAGTFYAYGVRTILLLMAVAPAVYAVLYARTEFGPATRPGTPGLRRALADFRSLGAILFGLLLFFQFGNEWSLAGWLPLVLIRRVGLSPPAALFVLTLYWMFLLTGRLGALAILPAVRHGRLLLGSGLLALFGCFLLFSTNNAFGAAMGVFFVGAGYASVYPLVAEAIGRRFPYYHPAFCDGIFSLALLGGLLAPATLGYAASRWGVGVVIGIPLVGTLLVIALLLLIWLESKVTGR